MTRELVTADPVPRGAAFSPGLAVDGWVFLAGQGGFDPATGELVPGGIGAQTEQALRNVETLLAAAGLTLRDLVSCLVHLSDLSDFAAYNEAYKRVLAEEPRPVRTTVGASLLDGMLIEVTVVARRGAGNP